MNNKISLDASKALLAEINTPKPDLAKIQAYLSEGADINYQAEEDGYTALMLAVKSENEPLVTYLLQQGADPLIPNYQKGKASDLALTHSPLYQLLRNYELLFATHYNDLVGAKAALNAGAKVNFQGQGGYTALLIAVEQNLLEFVELLLVNGADKSITLDDGRSFLSLYKDHLIYQTLDYGKPFTDEQKRRLLEHKEEEAREEELREEARLKAIEKRKKIPFSLDQLKIRPYGVNFDLIPSKAQLDELEQHFGHPLPNNLKEIFLHYHGGRPTLDYFGEDEHNSIDYFYYINENRNSPGNIWWVINNFAEYLGPQTLPFAQDDYGGIFFLKWVDGKAEVWLFQYGDQPFAYDDEDDDPERMHTAYTLIANSLDEFLGALYAVEE